MEETAARAREQESGRGGKVEDAVPFLPGWCSLRFGALPATPREWSVREVEGEVVKN
jgi:hypothetical protein